jgi:phage shock protein A
MFATLRTLVIGANARAEERVREVYSIELIEQKIREAEASLRAAKATLASLIQRKRSEERLAQGLETRIADLMKRAQAALNDGNEDLAREAASAVAEMENELQGRRQTIARLTEKTSRLQRSIEAGHRRIIDLRQGAISARAIRAEQGMQRRLNRTLAGRSSLEEAEELIAQVLGEDDPLEQAEILRDIDRGLTHADLPDRMAAEGYGAATRTTADDVLGRLKKKS